MKDKPVSVYVAETNLDAQLIANLLRDAGVDAHAIEDHSTAGLFSLGTLSEIHRPEIFVPPGDVARAEDVIAKYEASKQGKAEPAADVFCYHCGAECSAADSRCPSCAQPLNWNGAGEDCDEAESVSNLDQMRRVKRPIAALIVAWIVLMFGIVLIQVAMSLFGQLQQLFNR